MEARSTWCALEGRIIRRVVPLVCSFVCYAFSSILLSLSLSFSLQDGCPPPRLRGPGTPTEVLPSNRPPCPLAHVRALKEQR